MTDNEQRKRSETLSLAGGTNDQANLWTLCRDCNAGKSDGL